MGMRCQLQQVSPELLVKLQSDGDFTIGFFKYASVLRMEGFFPGTMPPELRQLLDQRLAELNPPDRSSPPPDFQTGAGPLLDLDKSWNGLHFLLTGSQWEGEPPLSYTVMGKDSLVPADENDRNWSYGPPRFVPPETVKEIDSDLKATSFESLWNSRDFTAPENDIYAFHPDDLEEEKEWLENYFNLLSKFYESAAANDSAVVMIIT